MISDLHYSIIKHLRDNVVGIESVEWKYDGISLAGLPKPFIMVDDGITDVDTLEASRTERRYEYRFEIGIFADSEFERNLIASHAEELLLDEIDLYKTDGAEIVKIGTFTLEIERVSPMNQMWEVDDSMRHRVYYDVVVELYRNTDGTFIQ